MELISVSHTPAPSNIGADITINISPSGILRLDGHTPPALVLYRMAASPSMYEPSHVLCLYISVCASTSLLSWNHEIRSAAWKHVPHRAMPLRNRINLHLPTYKV